MGKSSSFQNSGAGGGVLFYHNVTYIAPHNDDFRDVLGAVTLGPTRPGVETIVPKVIPQPVDAP